MGLLGIVGCGALVGLGCFEPPRLVPRDAGADTPPGPPALVVAGVEVRGFDGVSYPPDAAPRRPRLALVSSVPLVGEVPLFLFAGELDAALTEDLAASPLRSEHLARAIDCERSVEADRVVLVPRAPLVAGGVYTLALAAWAEWDGRGVAEVSSWRLVVGRAPELGAAARLAWPPDGALDVGTSLAAVVIAFDGEVRGTTGITLQDPAGPIRGSVVEVDCAAFGESGTCIALRPAAPLAPHAEHHLRAEGLRDATGAPVPAFAARFVTGAGRDVSSPALLPLSCFVDEREIDGLCVRVGEQELALRALATEPVRATLFADGRSVASLGPRGEVEVALRHGRAGDELEVQLDLTDLGGLVLGRRLVLRAPVGLPRLVITEVRADPLGPEPDQEYVELTNEGPGPIDLAGCALADGFERPGDLLPARLLPPGARVLVVADGFDPDGPSDSPPIPAGTPLVRIGSALGEGGLSSAGEPLVLRLHAADDVVHRLSSAPASRAPEPGACLARTAEGFVHARDACTPGRK